MAKEAARPPTLTKSTLTPLGNVIAIAALVGTAAWWAASVCNRLENIEKAVSKQDDERVGKANVQMWLALLKQANSTMVVPEFPK